MRLPENSQARRKILLLIALGAGAAVYGVWIGIYDPIRRDRDEALTKSAELEANLQTARAQISRMGAMQRELVQIAGDLQDRSEQDMLHPRLGNYLLQAREILQQYANAAGVPTIQIEEIGLVDPPTLPKKTSPYLVRAYSARVTTQCGLDSFLTWIRAMEEGNALLAISQLTIAAQPEDPLNHLIQFEVQWPVWVDPDVRETVRRLASEVMGGKGP